MGSKQGDKAKKWCSGKVPVAPDGFEVEYAVPCRRCHIQTVTLSLEGRLSRHRSKMDSYFCPRSGALFTPVEKSRARWRVVEKISVPEANERHARPVQQHRRPAAESQTTAAWRKPGAVVSPLADSNDFRAQARLRAARLNYSSDDEQTNDNRYRASRELYDSSTSVIAKLSAPQGTGRRR